MAQSRSRRKRTVKPASVRKAQKAVTALRDTIGLPSGPLAREIAAKVRELSRDKRGIVEWEVRVLRPGESVEAVCNCHCYA
jgi:hypothetical protein